MALNRKQSRFVEEYLIDLNATQAAIRTGYSRKTAHVIGDENLKKPEIAAQVRKAMDERSARTSVTQDRVLRELAKIGFADLRKAVIWRANVTGMVRDDDGSERLAVTNEVQIVDSAALDDDTAGAIAEISQTDKGGLRVKMHDKKGALEAMGRHLGMFKDKIEHSGPDGGPMEVVSVRQRAKAMAALIAKQREPS